MNDISTQDSALAQDLIEEVVTLSLIHIPSPRDVEESRMPSSA